MISELPVVSVHIPPSLRALAGGASEVMASGERVGEVLAAVGHQFPLWLLHVLDAEGGLQAGVVVFLGGEPVGDLGTPVGQEESLSVQVAGDTVIEAGSVAPHFPEPEHAISIGTAES